LPEGEAGKPLTVPMLANAVRKAFKGKKTSLMRHPLSWAGHMWDVEHPLDFLGTDGGGGIGSGPALSVGAAVGNAGTDLHTVAILGDGDFAMGGHAIWTAARHRIPLLVLINNNRSYFNDELHQETIAVRRARPPQNRWIGQRMTDPDLDFAKFVEAQGAVGIGPVKTPAELDAAIKRGVDILKKGGVCLIDVHIEPGEERGAASTGHRDT
jgi:thiamine pyrophosphate-dependent acetolactate synthase large subunit-like protein